MPVLDRLRSLVRNLFFGRRVEADLEAEVRSHLEILTAVLAGVTVVATVVPVLRIARIDPARTLREE
jgi:ABC-type lipoprotein release transport system permease subunit